MTDLWILRDSYHARSYNQYTNQQMLLIRYNKNHPYNPFHDMYETPTYFGTGVQSSESFLEKSNTSPMFSSRFDIQGSVHRKCIPKYDQQDATLYSFYFCKLLYMFRVDPPPIIRITLYLQHLVFVRPLLLPVAIVEELNL